MFSAKLHRLLIATTLGVAALGATPLANAGLNAPQKHPDGQGTIIGVLKHPDIIGVLKHPDFRIQMRKSGGDGGSAGR